MLFLNMGKTTFPPLSCKQLNYFNWNLKIRFWSRSLARKNSAWMLSVWQSDKQLKTETYNVKNQAAFIISDTTSTSYNIQIHTCIKSIFQQAHLLISTKISVFTWIKGPLQTFRQTEIGLCLWKTNFRRKCMNKFRSNHDYIFLQFTWL